MSHPQQLAFVASVEAKFPECFTGCRVLEVGSLNINGTVRDHFTDCFYVGVDLAQGPGVDVISPGQDLEYPDGDFTTVISTECFEHNPQWAETFTNMHRMAASLVVFTCATTGRAEHGTARSDTYSSPFTAHDNYYRNLTEQDFREAFDLDAMFSVYEFSTNGETCDLYFWGVK